MLFLTLLCYEYNPCIPQDYYDPAYKYSKKNEEVILKEFSNCSCIDIYENITEHEITDNQVTCIQGSFVIGTNESFQAIIGYTNNIYNESFHINSTQENVLGVLERNERIPDLRQINWKSNHALTKIQCRHYPCKIQVLRVSQSYLFSDIFNLTNSRFKYTVGLRSFVSTKRSSSVNIPYKFDQTVEFINESIMNVERSNIFASFVVAGFNTKTFTYKKDKNITLRYNTDAERENFANQESGSLGITSVLNGHVYGGESIYFENRELRNMSFNEGLTLTWEESKKETSEEEKQMLIPEFEAVLSTEGGVLTQENIQHQHFPGDPTPSPNDGLKPGAVAGIVIACIAIVAIIVVCIWLFALGGIKKCKKDKSGSSSSSKKEQEEK